MGDSVILLSRACIEFVSLSAMHLIRYTYA